MKKPHPELPSGISRRAFLKGLGTAAVTAAASGSEAVAAELAKANAEQVVGPGKVPVTFRLNGQPVRVEVEPRVTLLDALRLQLGHTGPKEGCDRGSCGACTVLFDGKPVYACMKLAVEASGADVETIEGQAIDGKLSAVQAAFIQTDGSQCGFCTPGFIMSITGLLRENSHPTEAEVRKACSGNVCRCGSHPRIVAAALEAAGVKTASRAEVITFHHA